MVMMSPASSQRWRIECTKRWQASFDRGLPHRGLVAAVRLRQTHDERPQFGEDGGLGAEHRVDGLHSDARVRRHGLEGGGGIAVAAEEAARRLEDPPLRDGRLLLSNGRAHERSSEQG